MGLFLFLKLMYLNLIYTKYLVLLEIPLRYITVTVTVTVTGNSISDKTKHLLYFKNKNKSFRFLAVQSRFIECIYVQTRIRVKVNHIFDHPTHPTLARGGLTENLPTLHYIRYSTIL